MEKKVGKGRREEKVDRKLCDPGFAESKGAGREEGTESEQICVSMNVKSQTPTLMALYL